MNVVAWALFGMIKLAHVAADMNVLAWALLGMHENGTYG